MEVDEFFIRSRVHIAEIQTLQDVDSTVQGAAKK